MQTIKTQPNQIFYSEGEVIDIDAYVNNSNLNSNKVTKQIDQYFNDALWFCNKVCFKVIKTWVKTFHQKFTGGNEKQ